jgi:DNA-binding transcriptional regulator LsrR (DeoR family)
MSAEHPRRWRRWPTAEDIERDAQALALHAERVGYREIAERLGVSLGTAHNMVRRAMRAYLADHGAEEVRADILARSDLVLQAVMPKAAQGDPQAIDRMLRLDRQLRDLYGLDKPKTLKHEFLDRNSVDAELQALAAQVGRPLPPRIIDTRALPEATP